MTERLGGKVAIVTGAARGLGACISELYAREGASVLLTDIRDELGEGVAGRIAAAGERAVYQHLDVRSRPDWDAAVRRCEEELGPPDVLVQNAFLYTHPALADLSFEEWQQSLDVILSGGFHGFQSLLPGMRERGRGTFVVISSSNGPDISLPSQAGYQAAKAGLTALTRHVAVTYADDGIRSNAIHPGPIRGPMLEEVGFLQGAEAVANVFPIKRLAEPEEIAWAAVYLASDESSYTTAAIFVIDGGSVATINLPPRG